MRILIVGGKGTIGRAIVEKLKEHHELIIAGRTSGDVQVDLTSVESIETMFKKVGHVDAIVNASGTAKFQSIEEMTPEDNLVAVQSKLLGQINLALIGQKYLRRDGSITLTTGIMKDDPIPGGASAAMAFVKSVEGKQTGQEYQVY